ncbi:hypothetical protein VFPPC_15735 [Pochonia chlamydosporia 170]|uniref:Uncharacterized protein n=1 Tax=Pochonia chlamydosporia 170 TaxID=1380566 RepID=A0A179FQH1_METCM|nr:hypothetical protein VFPPC_15735 [Pochonia chlamydosporia 170]OAQ67832.1 hypothetical protein VFPPC_15735 [Pochonia chlamydosporia 170]
MCNVCCHQNLTHPIAQYGGVSSRGTEQRRDIASDGPNPSLFVQACCEANHFPRRQVSANLREQAAPDRGKSSLALNFSFGYQCNGVPKCRQPRVTDYFVLSSKSHSIQNEHNETGDPARCVGCHTEIHLTSNVK